MNEIELQSKVDNKKILMKKKYELSCSSNNHQNTWTSADNVKVQAKTA